MKLDVHGCNVEEAFEEILFTLKELVKSGDNRIGIIHGYRNGQKLKEFFRSQLFPKRLKIFGYKIIRIKQNSNPGYTAFTIKLEGKGGEKNGQKTV